MRQALEDPGPASAASGAGAQQRDAGVQALQITQHTGQQLQLIPGRPVGAQRDLVSRTAGEVSPGFGAQARLRLGGEVIEREATAPARRSACPHAQQVVVRAHQGHAFGAVAVTAAQCDEGLVQLVQQAALLGVGHQAR